MNRNEFELEKLKLEVERFHRFMDTIAKLATVGGWVYAIYLIMDGLKSIVLARSDSIEALAKVVQSMHLNTILGWVGAVMGASGWWFERKGKKRAYKISADLRKQLESGDPHRSRSGLDDNGHTPK